MTVVISRVKNLTPKLHDIRSMRGRYSSTKRLLDISKMNTNIIEVNNNPEASKTACELLRSGHVIAVPTDTIYGLAVNASNTAAIRKLYEIKGRSNAKPVSICVSKVEDTKVWADTQHLPAKLLYELLPGSVTVILNRSTLLNEHLNPGISKIGIRIPKNEFVIETCSLLGSPIALTSANRSSEPSCLSPIEFCHLWNALEAVFDSGVVGNDRSGSTIVDLSLKNEYSIVRTGSSLESVLSILAKYNLRAAKI